MPKLTSQELAVIDAAVESYKGQIEAVGQFTTSVLGFLTGDKVLRPFIHFSKHRIKDPDHLREKLKRKALERKKASKKPLINSNNLFSKVTDLAGIRILYLHTDQFGSIHKSILRIIREQRYILVEEPFAYCWDEEYRDLFKKFGINKVLMRGSMYTSAHYVIRANNSTRIPCEIQVRTLMDEVWGEVSHRVNYPEESTSDVCREQLKVLARFTSGCTRLVDAVFRSNEAGANIG